MVVAKRETGPTFFLAVSLLGLCFAALSIIAVSPVQAGVLPEERLDILYHKYEGGGVTVDGPSYLVRKNFGEKVSAYGNYYEDFVTSASIDVLTSGSPYTEQRTEYSLGADYLNDRTLMSLSYTNSTESDYIANTVGFSVSQEFFGDLTTITLSASRGDDTVKNNFNENFEEKSGRKRYGLGFSQILTRGLLYSSNIEVVLDEGFLNNPYRQIRYRDGANTAQQSENYPETRNSSAWANRAIIYIPGLDSSVRLEYRLYQDSWEIKANNAEIRYTHPLNDALTVQAHYRTYKQNQAFFYQDLFEEAPDENTFAARDKELSDYSSTQFGWGLSYTINSRFRLLNNSSVNLYWDRFEFEYDNFLDVQAGGTPGQEPNYSLRADVVRLFFSTYF